MYCHPASGSKSMLDLSVADPSLFLDLTWTVVDDLHGSDHFPVLLQFSQVEKAPDVGRWDFRNVNWDLYSDLCASAIAEEAVFSGKTRLFSSPIYSPLLPPKSSQKPSANPGCPRCLGSLININWPSKKGKKRNVLFFGNPHPKTFLNTNNFKRKLATP